MSCIIKERKENSVESQENHYEEIQNDGRIYWKWKEESQFFFSLIRVSQFGN